MDKIIEEMAVYLREIVGIKIDSQSARLKNVPVFLSEHYTFCNLRSENGMFLGVIIRAPENFKPSSFEKHKRYFLTDNGNEQGIVLIARQLSAFVRKRLIEMRVPFVVPKVQLYWPELGLEFRSHIKNKIASHAPVETFDPSTQAVLIGALNNSYEQPITPKALSENLVYSAMSMTRALNQIEAAKIGHIQKSGKQRLLSFPEDKKSLWLAVKDRLNNPIREKARFLESDIPKEYRLLAGESALSEISALVEPYSPTYAVGREKWKRIEKKAIPHLEINEHGTCEVQVWRYDPVLFAEKNCVDAISLYLSMENNADERVQMALEEAIKERL